jgi:SAM-dependent methyltransferase
MTQQDFVIASSSIAGLSHREEANKLAWDRLYASTDDLVWGAAELPFVGESLRFLHANRLLPDNPAILDAATGEGRNLPALLRAGSIVTACDASPAALNKLNQRFGDQVATVECDLARMPFSSGTFDMVLACDIIETLPNLEDVLLETARILRMGGVLVANVPDFDDGISGTEMNPLSSNEFLYQGNYYFRFQNEKEFLQILDHCGFSLISCEPTTWWEPPHPGFRNDVHSHTSRIVMATRRIG